VQKAANVTHWLREKVMEYLELSLADADLGHVDGFDMGTCPMEKKKKPIL